MDTIITTSLPQVVQISRPTLLDDRGFFRESFRIKELETAVGIPFQVAQANHSRSSKNTLRGIHIAPWNKLIYVTRGTVQAVVVDFKEGSPTFGKYESFVIGEDKRVSIFIPAGYGNSYFVMSDEADYTYLTDREWEPNKERGILWNDPDLKIEWKLEGTPILSEKDQQNPVAKTLFPGKF